MLIFILRGLGGGRRKKFQINVRLEKGKRLNCGREQSASLRARFRGRKNFSGRRTIKRISLLKKSLGKKSLELFLESRILKCTNIY